MDKIIDLSLPENAGYLLSVISIPIGSFLIDC